MIDPLQILLLSLIQGLTEFLPISSSAHLILFSTLTGATDQGLAFDIAVHFGSLLAIITVLRRELWLMAKSCLHQIVHNKSSFYSLLTWKIGLATIPVCIIGLVFHDLISTTLRSPKIIAFSTIGFGILLWISDYFGKKDRALDSLGWVDAIKIGISQALALIPGTSRSGITMTSGIALGFTRESAAKFSFLLSIPVIISAMSLETLKLLKDSSPIPWGGLFTAMGLSAVCAYICIILFLKFIQQIGMGPFVIYRIVLGCSLLWHFS